MTLKPEDLKRQILQALDAEASDDDERHGCLVNGVIRDCKAAVERVFSALEVAPVPMLIDQDWLTRHVATDPDTDVEARSAAPPPALPDEVVWLVKALSPFMPITTHDTPDYAEVTFGDHQSQAMTMDPGAWNELTQAFTPFADRLPTEEGA